MVEQPLCGHFGRCGGCSLQDVDYAAQVEDKRKTLSAVCGLDDISVFTGPEFGYRSRMDFVFHPRGLGFRVKGGWRDFFDVERCAISNERINGILAELRGCFTEVDSFDPVSQQGTFRYAVIRAADGDSSVSFILNGASDLKTEALERIRTYAGSSSAANIMVAYTRPECNDSLSQDFQVVKGREFLKETYLGKTFNYPVQGFFQNNPLMAEKMQQHCRSLLAQYDASDAHLLDLYGGVGTFGITNADLFDRVTIVESNPDSIRAAETNITENSTDNVRAIPLDAGKIRELDLSGRLFVVTDPPRGGMHPKTIKRLNELAPEAMIYVSCNPKQLALGLPNFKEYTVKSAAMFDMFPQTPHIEAMVELV